MSDRAKSHVWELPCPEKYNGLEFRPSHKFVLIAYADHADHWGRNVFPSVSLISRKTGFDTRTVQRLTHDMHKMGLIEADGQGPQGTNRWKLSFVKRGGTATGEGDSLTGGGWRGDRGGGDIPSGDIPSGDIPSGDTLPPELIKPNMDGLSIDIQNKWSFTLAALKKELPKAKFETWLEHVRVVSFDGRTMWIAARNTYGKDWIESNAIERMQELSGYYVKVVVAELVEAE